MDYVGLGLFFGQYYVVEDFFYFVWQDYVFDVYVKQMYIVVFDCGLYMGGDFIVQCCFVIQQFVQVVCGNCLVQVELQLLVDEFIGIVECVVCMYWVDYLYGCGQVYLQGYFVVVEQFLVGYVQ